MRIDAYLQVNQLYQASKPRTAAKTSKASASDSLEISNRGRDFQIAKKAVSESSDVREDKVKDIQDRMKAGTYHPAIEDVAESLADRLLG